MFRRQSSIPLLYLLSFISGSAALGYQMVWARMFGTGLGNEMAAVLAVVGAFMGGMALGAWKLDSVIARSRRPGKWYGWLEIVIGLWAAAAVVLIPLTNQFALHLIGLEPSPFRHWAVAFALPFLVLLPATAALGATFPAMERFLSPLKADGRCVGAIYAANTLGAVVGILASTFFIAPAIGFRLTIFVLGVANIVCGVAALRLATLTTAWEPVGGRKPGRDAADVTAAATGASQTAALRSLVTVFVTGLLGIGYEVVGVRVLSQVLENTVYTFAAILAVFLLGTSIGGALQQRFSKRASGRLLLTDLLTGLALACVFGIFALAKMQRLYHGFRAAFGDGKFGVLSAEMTAAAAVFLLPTILMGATFSHLVQTARRKDGGVGVAAALNTLGGAAAPALFGVLLLPLLGSKWTMTLIAFAYLPLAPTWRRGRWGFLILMLGLSFLLPGNLYVVQVPPRGRLVEYREGVMASVAVIEDPKGDRVLRVNDRFQMGGTAAANAEYRHAHLPLLLHPAPKRALVLGLGTGITLGASSLHPRLHTDGVELVPEVVEVMPQFDPFNFLRQNPSRINLFVADARRFVRATDQKYDVIIADLFHPARDGEGFLYTREHFAVIRQRLAPDGLFCQWLPLHQLDDAMLRIITRTFLDVFPDGQAWLLHFNVDIPVVGLIGAVRPMHYSNHWLEDRLSDSLLAEQLKKLGITDSIRLFGHLLAGPSELRLFAGEAPLNSDDQPRVAFGAPRFVYETKATSYGRLLQLLAFRAPAPDEVLRLEPDPGTNSFSTRLTHFVLARNVYLNGLVDEAEGRQGNAIDKFVESARLSKDFTAGYAQCLTRASLQVQAEPAKARALLERLVAAQPSRPIAREMLKRLFDQPGTARP